MDWIDAKDRLPERGERILCEFQQGTLWAGRYQGAKQSFARWVPVITSPPPQEPADA